MIRNEPATIWAELSARIDRLLSPAVTYFSPENLQLRQLLADAGKLIKVDPIAGHLATAKVQQLSGNIERVSYHVDNALRLGGGVLANSDAVACFANLGAFSQAQGFYRRGACPKDGFFTHTAKLGLICGAFETMEHYIEEAVKLKIDLSSYPVDVVRRVRAVLAREGMTDADVATMLDMAGEVLREERLFFADVCHDIDIDDLHSGGEQCVYLRLKVAQPGERVSDMSAALFEKIATRMDRIPASLHVAFRPV